MPLRITTTVAVAAALVATACTAAPHPRTAGAPTSVPSPATPTGSPTASPTPATPAPGKSAEPAAVLTDKQALPIGMAPTLLVPAGPIVYAFSRTSGTVTLARVDIAAKTVTARRSYPGDFVRASVGGGRLAIMLQHNGHTPPVETVKLLDLRTLAQLATRTLSVAGDVLARPEATYVSTPGRILALDPRTLRTRRTIQVDDYPHEDDSGAEMAADPRSHILYAGISDQAGPQVDIVDLGTGRVVARPRIDGVLDVEPQGYGDDGWVVYATGNFAGAELLSPTGRVLARSDGPVGPNSTTIVVTGRHLWSLTSSAWSQPVACRDLRTGAVEGEAKIGETVYPLAADNTHVYLQSDTTLLVYTPAGRCA